MDRESIHVRRSRSVVGRWCHSVAGVSFIAQDMISEGSSGDFDVQSTEGQTVEVVDGHAGQPAADPIHPSNLISTITHTLFDIGKLRLETGVSDDLVKKLAESEPIRALM